MLMYEIDYDYIKNEYINNSRLLFTDADNLMYEIYEDVYEDFSKHKEMFDFSNYSTGSKYYDDSNKLVFGKKKNKTDSVAFKEFLGLKPGLYSVSVDDSSEHKKKQRVRIKMSLQQ